MRAALATLAFCAALSATRADATSVHALSLAALVSQSTLIVHARVVDRTDRVQRTGGVLAPRTTTRFAVIETLFGTPREVLITAPVGAMGEGRARGILGFPSFAVSEEVVLFLHEGRGALSPVGLGQGVFRVRHDQATGAVCTRVLADMDVVGDTAIPDRLPLADLTFAVRSLLGGSQ